MLQDHHQMDMKAKSLDKEFCKGSKKFWLPNSPNSERHYLSLMISRGRREEGESSEI
jgi:hypothetical protein